MAPIPDPEVLLVQGRADEYKQAIQRYAKAEKYRGNVFIVEPTQIPPKNGGWDLRDLCKQLKPSASWDTIKPHDRFKLLPILNLDFLGSTDRKIKEEAIKNFVRVNHEMHPFLQTNPLTSTSNKGDRNYNNKGGRNYKPPQRHCENKTLTSETDYKIPFLDFFVCGKEAIGVTDVGRVTYGLEAIKDLPDIPPQQRQELEEILADPTQFQGDRHNLRLITQLFGSQIQYPALSRDIGVRMHDGQVERVKEGDASASICYIDGVSGPLPTLYVEKSGLKEDGSSQLWFTRTHNEYGCLSFLNLMFSAGKETEDLLEMLKKNAKGFMEAREKALGFKVWNFVLLDNGENERRANFYAKDFHDAKSWHQLVDWVEGPKRDHTVRVKDLLDYGVDVAITIQRVGEMVVGGPGVGHGVYQYGTTTAVAVNIAHLDLLHLAVRMNKGGDLHHRGNRKTVGPNPWFKITADSILSIIRSLFDDLKRVCKAQCLNSAERRRRLRRLQGDIEQLGTSFEMIEASMEKCGLTSLYSKGLMKQGWMEIYLKDYKRILFEALDRQSYIGWMDIYLKDYRGILCEAMEYVLRGNTLPPYILSSGPPVIEEEEGDEEEGGEGSGEGGEEGEQQAASSSLAAAGGEGGKGEGEGEGAVTSSAAEAIGEGGEGDRKKRGPARLRKKEKQPIEEEEGEGDEVSIAQAGGGGGGESSRPVKKARTATGKGGGGKKRGIGDS